LDSHNTTYLQKKTEQNKKKPKRHAPTLKYRG